MSKFGVGALNSNGSVNFGPLSPVWYDGVSTPCVGEACNLTFHPAVIVVLATLSALVIFFMLLREGGIKRAMIASIIPVWLVSAAVYHVM
jgi:hypothetical protein